MIITAITASSPAFGAAEVRLELPTENRALFEGRPDDFFQPTISRREISGHFGFVRTGQPEPARYFERFHKGIDIRPVRRDPAGRPLDPVTAAAPGRVVYTNRAANRSNYGLYVVIEHQFGFHRAHTFYAHLNRIEVKEGDLLQTGDRVGILGFTGAGINLERAHLHFEFTFLLNRDYAGWYNSEAHKFEPRVTPNDHGNHNGLNHMGIDPIPILEATRRSQPPTIGQIFAAERVQFRVHVPAGRDYFCWQKRFPEMVQGGIDGPLPAAWEIDCTRTGIPLHFRRLDQPVPDPVLAWFRPNLSLQDWFTRGLIEGRGHEQLSRQGKKWASQITWIP